MRGAFSVLLLVAMVTLTAGQIHAQRGGFGGGGISGHAGSGFAGMASPSASHAAPSFAPAPGFFHGPASYGNAGFGGLPFRSMSTPVRGYAGDYRHGRGRSGNRSYPYNFGYNSFLVPNVVGYPYGFGYPFIGDDLDNDQENGPDQSTDQGPENPQAVQGAGPGYEPGENAGEPQEEYVQAAPPPPAAGSDVAQNEQPSFGYRPAYQGDGEPVPTQPVTTLIFNDGRPNAQVHNYALTPTTLYGLDDGDRIEIPISELDVAATVRANRSAGVDFSLPADR